MSRRDFQKNMEAARAQREREQLAAAMRAAPPLNGSSGGHPPVPFPVMAEAAIVVSPLTKLCWERYFAIVDAHWQPGMDKVRREQFANEAMAMAITPLARIIGLKIEDSLPPGFGEEAQAETEASEAAAAESTAEPQAEQSEQAEQAE